MGTAESDRVEASDKVEAVERSEQPLLPERRRSLILILLKPLPGQTSRMQPL
jgi:hypothetical protein